MDDQFMREMAVAILVCLGVIIAGLAFLAGALP